MGRRELVYMGWFAGAMMGLGFGFGLRRLDLSAWATEDQVFNASILLYIGGVVFFEIAYHYLARDRT